MTYCLDVLQLVDDARSSKQSNSAIARIAHDKRITALKVGLLERASTPIHSIQKAGKTLSGYGNALVCKDRFNRETDSRIAEMAKTYFALPLSA